MHCGGVRVRSLGWAGFLLTVFWSSDDDGQLRVKADTRDILGVALQSLNTGLVLQHRGRKFNMRVSVDTKLTDGHMKDIADQWRKYTPFLELSTLLESSNYSFFKFISWMIIVLWLTFIFS